MLNTQGLALDQAPPIKVPFRFFLTAPLFAIGAGLLLIFDGPNILNSRWTPPAFALTHLISVGFLAQIMIGAVMQLLPVLAGSSVPAVMPVGSVINLLLVAGTLLFAGGFLGGAPELLTLGGAMMVLAFGLFVVVAGIALAKAHGATDTVRAMRLGLTALIATFTLGFWLVLGVAGWLPLPGGHLQIALHLGWGILGWVGLILVGVTMELVPMFYVTPLYPAVFRTWLSPLIFASLIFWSLSVWLYTDAVVVSMGSVALMFFAFALITLWLTRHRKRPIQDATLYYVWIGCISLIGAVLSWALSDSETLTGLLVLGGVCLAFPSGMLYKIVPFLCWFHLQATQLASGRFDYSIPPMKTFLSENRARWQFWLYLAALMALLLAVWQPEPVARVGGVLLALSSFALWANLLAAASRYRRELMALQSTSAEASGRLP